MVDVNKQIRMVVKTGKVDFGTKTALSSVRQSKAKLVILASNCPGTERSALYIMSSLSVPGQLLASITSLALLCRTDERAVFVPKSTFPVFTTIRICLFT